MLADYSMAKKRQQQEILNPFHGKEQPGKTFKESPLSGAPMSFWL
jgi:hypothetical protein